MTKKKTARFLGPPCVHGNAPLLLDDGKEKKIVVVRETVDGEPLLPGETTYSLKGREGSDELEVVGEFTHEGPSRASTPAYRSGYDTIFGKRRSAGVS